MNISRTLLDMLGIRLYDNPVAVVVELVANAYDADAEHVRVKIPLGQALATKVAGNVVDKGLTISVEDDGTGISPELVNDYLRVGVDRRAIAPLSQVKRRAIMGRKGIGILAPFGICKKIEIWSAGGERTSKGYRVSHFIINHDEMTDEPYRATIGHEDGHYSIRRGTVIFLRDFLARTTPDQDTFHRQISRAFVSGLPAFKIMVVNTTNGNTSIVGELPIEIDEGTKIDLAKKPIVLANGTERLVTGWMALAKRPYANPEMAGVRIYARGKLVAVTRDFNLRVGFTGEFVVRPYVVGAINADWLDSDIGEDLIRSDRQDILWDSETGVAFQTWGQLLLRELGGRRVLHRQKAKSGLKSTPRKRVTDLEKPLRELRRLIDQHHVGESKYQELMQKYPWVLGNEYKEIQRHRKLDDKDIPDFTALRARDEYRDVIEIKSPFISVSRQDGELTSEFNDAWNQAERYLNFVRDETDYLSRKGLKFDCSRCILIAGSGISGKARTKIRGKQKLNPAIVFYSYEELEASIIHTIDIVRKLQGQE